MEELCSGVYLTNKRHFDHYSEANLDRHMSLDDIEGEDDLRIELPCPYCFESFELTSLCGHLECEHCFEVKSVICPVCTTKVGKDLIGHIMLQHGPLFKDPRRRRFRRPSSSGSSLSLHGKEFREGRMRILTGGTAGTSFSSSAVDPLFSVLTGGEEQSGLSDAVSSNRGGGSEGVKVFPPPKSTMLSASPSLSVEERLEKRSQAVLRASFTQQLLLSTIFGDT